ncbi:NADP-specific glutamate dehydrogenase [Alteromonas sp. CYL-A6]|uniref:NADP-specific glutamate dehydrogenase n=1 Tax=Alteromonas nitratireducens TaxID=3390813 RepID=UPI0034B13664
MSSQSNHDALISWLEERHPGQEEYLQAVREVAADIVPVYNANEQYKGVDVLRRLCVPERIITFNISWQNSEGHAEINQGWRVQHSGLIGPYKGGLRFHPTVNESILKFLAFEQTFKNALTSLPMGGAKGGSDFDPKGRSDTDIMRFCQAFMTELQRHIGSRTDVPAGDINVGAREIGYLYGHYRRIKNRFEGVITGKGVSFGGSYVRTEATGYGLIYFLRAVLETHETPMKDQRVLISGAGNVALHAALKAIHYDAKVLTLSNSRGAWVYEDGITEDMVRFALTNKDQHDNILAAMADEFGGKWHKNKTPWFVEGDIALPCATQNELDEEDARLLIKNGCSYVLEGANMPCTNAARHCFLDAKLPHVPSKAANAGGVALSGLEMSQNAGFQPSTFEHLDSRLKAIMEEIHQLCVDEGQDDGFINYAKGANIAAFRRLADAMVAQGI